MAVTKLISGLPHRGMTQEEFDAAMAKLMVDLPAWAGQVNETAASVTSAVAGGAFAIPYTWKSSTGYAVGIGSLATDPGSLYVDSTSAQGKNVAAQLADMAASSSVIKGHFRICKVNDPGTFAIYAIASRTPNAGYSTFGVTLINSSNGFTPGDSVVLYFQRTGDAGDLGRTYIKVSDRKASGVAGGYVNAGLLVRTLNTVEYNNIPGAALTSNYVNLPIGTYEVWGRAPAYRSKGHQAQLWNVTTNQYIIAGAGGYSTSQFDTSSDSFVTGRFVVSGAAQGFQLKHFFEYSDGFASHGMPTSAGFTEVYAELIFTKIG